MAERQRADDRFEQVLSTRFECRKFGPQRCVDFAFDIDTLFDREQINPHATFEKLAMRFHRRFVVQQPCQARIGGREEVIVYRQSSFIGTRTEVIRFLPRHVTDVAIHLCLRGIVEALRSVSRYAAQQIGIVVVLATHKLAVVIEFKWQMDLVAGRAEIGRLMERLQERLPMEFRFGDDELVVDPLQQRIVAEGKRVMLGLFNRVVAVAARTVDVGDRVTHGAGDARLRRRVIDIVKLRIVKSSAEERHRVVAPSAPPRGLHIAIPLQRDLSRLTHRSQVEGIVERTEVMGAVFPAGMDVSMTFFAVFVVHHHGRGYEVSRGGARK